VIQKASLHSVIEQTVSGLGYELVEIEFSARGLLRVTIDLLFDGPDPITEQATVVSTADKGKPKAPWEGQFVTVEDCEVVSRQLSYVLTVENCEYSRLEISSPGLDRPLNKAIDFKRFAGSQISLRLREPIQGKRNFEGLLSVQEDGQLALDWDEKPKASVAQKAKQAGQKVGSKSSLKKAVANKNAAQDTVNILSFEFADVEKANLVPIVVFNRKSEAKDSGQSEPEPVALRDNK
jgi:ribosome maturation factor RimP